jgi:hypothetical protein
LYTPAVFQIRAQAFLRYFDCSPLLLSLRPWRLNSRPGDLSLFACVRMSALLFIGIAVSLAIKKVRDKFSRDALAGRREWI